MVKRLLQYFIVKTDFWPLGWGYRRYYIFALKRIVHVLKKQPEIVAVYLVSGMASGSYIPGLSDIDLIVIVKDIEGSKNRVQKCYTQLSRVIPLLKKDELGVYSVEEIKQAYIQSNFHLKYKLFTECKKQGKLLFGTDVLRDFGELAPVQRNEFIIGQLANIWSLFLKLFLIKNKRTVDELFRNYSCCKLTSYFCGAFISARFGQDIFNRRKALEYAAPQFDATRQAHIRAVIGLMERRFSGSVSRMVEDTYDFCINTIQDTAGYMPGIPDSDEDKEEFAGAYYDLASLDFILSDANKHTIGLFVDRVKNKYREYITSVLVSPVDLLHIEEQDIGVFLVPQKHIPFEIIKELTAMLETPHCPQRLNLWVVTSDVSISLNGFDPTQIQSALFSLRWRSATFLYLCMPYAVRFGEPLRAATSKKMVMDYLWHDIQSVIAQNKTVIRTLINDQHIRRISNIEFQHLFWYGMQLKLVEDSVGAGKIFIPLSSKQVYRRCLSTEDLCVPWLEKFYNEYIKDLNGAFSDSERFFSQALEVLKEIHEIKPDLVYSKG